MLDPVASEPVVRGLGLLIAERDHYRSVVARLAGVCDEVESQYAERSKDFARGVAWAAGRFRDELGRAS